MKNYEVNAKSFLKASGIGAAVSHIASLLFTVVFALIISAGDIKDSVIKAISFVILCISAFLGGFLAAKILKCKALFAGLSSGGIYYLTLAVLSAAINSHGFSKMFLIKLALTAVFSALGGIVTTFKEKTVI